MPTSKGSPPRRNGTPVRVNTNGSTGRMHGLRIVSTPPKNASASRTIATTSGRNELQRKTVHAVSQTRRFRPVLEHVAQMTAATPTVHCGAHHPEGSIDRSADGVLERLPKAGPPRAAVELRRGREQREL